MPIVFAAGTTPSFLTEAVILLVAGASIAYVCYRFGLVPIAGFLLAGTIIGPNGLRLVRDQELVDAAAEVGVILLLFTIGIEFGLEKLAQIKRLIFGGGLQVGLATAATVAVLAAFGVDWRVGLFTGFLVALSSTAIVLKLLGDKGETNSEHGQLSLGLLIFQDLAIIVMVLLVPVLSGADGASGLAILFALFKAGAIIAVVLLFARRLMPKVLEMVARTCSPELFLLTVIAICFGTAYLTSLAGVSLSLGAFLAGLLVSESRFSEHALSEILPLQILFSVTFFVSVGMLLDIGFLVQNLPLALAAIALVLTIKIITTGVSVRALGYKLPLAAASALTLAQVGEFSFVLERAGREAGLSPAGLGEAGSQTFIASTVVLMVLTPLLMQLGSKIANRLEHKQVESAAKKAEAEPSPTDLPGVEDHVIIAGYGQAARRLVRVLAGSHIPYIITTLSPEGANEAESEGLLVMRGAASKQRTLQLAGIERAKMLVIADDEPAMAGRIAAVGRTLNPTMRIVVRTRYIVEAERLSEVGVDRVVAEEMESIIGLFGEVLRDYHISAAEIDRHGETLRRGSYAALRRAPAPDEEPVIDCQPDEDCFDTRTVTVRAGAPIAARSVGDLNLNEKYNLTLRGVRRDGTVVSDPPTDFVIQSGDELSLSGDVAAFIESASLFRPASAGADSRNVAADGSNSQTSGARRSDGADGGVDRERIVELNITESPVCSHVNQTHPVMPSAFGCEDCLKIGDTWVHLRICMTCGHVGCCDNSKNKHATKHFHSTQHPIIKSLEPGEDWSWCYVDETYL